MGALSAVALTAITGHAPRYRHLLQIAVPRASGSGLYSYHTFHDTAEDAQSFHYAIALGSREHHAYNISMRSPGKLYVGRWKFDVRNNDGTFSTAIANNIFYNGTYAYQAAPIECHVIHEVYVWTGSAWEELTPLSYRGRIVDADYRVREGPEGYQGQSSVITSESIMLGYINREWTEDDGDDDDTTINVDMAS